MSDTTERKPYTVNCTVCYGTGKRRGYPCRACAGQGKILVTPTAPQGGR